MTKFEEEKVFEGMGLRELPLDDRDFSLGAVFDLGEIDEVPMIDFEVEDHIPVRDQKATDFCTGYAVTSVSGDQERVVLSPEYQFGKTKEIDGEPESWGANLRDACKSAVKFGSIPQSIFDEKFGEKGRYDRDLVAYSDNFPVKWDEIAAEHKKKTFWAITGPYDTFDNIRCALWRYRSERCSIATGCNWRAVWNRDRDGVIDSIPKSDFGSGHAFTLIGQKIIKGKPYIKARLSNGTDAGIGGYFYFGRDVVNSEFRKFGLFMFQDIGKEEARVLSDNEWKMNIMTILVAKLVALVKKLSQ